MTTPAGPAAADDPSADALRRGRRALRPSLRALRHGLRALRHGALLLGVCAALCAGLGRLAAFPEVPGIFPKWAYFKEHRDEFDVLFLGSSRFFHQIIPAQFDAAVGGSVRSFNFGYDGLWPPESFYLLRQILKLRAPHLRYVVIDLMNLDSLLDARTNSSQRLAYWHDWRHTGLAWRDVWAVPRPPEVRRDLLLQHAGMWFRKACNLGRGSEWLGNRLQPPLPRKRPLAWEGSAGFEAGPAHGLPAPLRPRYLEAVEGLRHELPAQTLPPVLRDALRDVIAEVRAAGVEPLFVITPTINALENFTHLPDGVTLIALNDPSANPELFDPEIHYDTWHLNERGAELMTAVLAARCKPIFDARR